MISKELLSEVLDENQSYIETISVDGSLLYYSSPKFNHGTPRNINIYELAHKCKEWVFNNGLMFDIKWHTDKRSFYISIKPYGQHSQHFCADTEPEAIFKACQWILDQPK